MLPSIAQDTFRMKRALRPLFLTIFVTIATIQYSGSVLSTAQTVRFNSNMHTCKHENGLAKTSRTHSALVQTLLQFTSPDCKLELMPVGATLWNISNTKPIPYPQDLMTVGPYNFLQNYKNPCYKGADGVLSCLPYFYLAGFPKSGTTDLFSRIIRHPDVSSLSPKEPHWITRRRFDFDSRQKKYPTIENYLSEFSHAAVDIDASGNSSFHPMIVGDYSACTMWDNSNWKILKENKNTSKPVHTVPDFIHHLYPKTKIVVILRNPIDRLYSGYLFFTKANKSAIDFHERVERAIKCYHACSRIYSERYCLLVRPNKEEVYNCGLTEISKKFRIHVGLYYYFIIDFLRVFPRKQLLILKTEDYSINMANTLKKVFSFLGIAPLGPDEMTDIVSNKTKHNIRRQSDQAVGAMMPETRQLLHKFYKSYNAKLADLLGRTFWD